VVVENIAIIQGSELKTFLSVTKLSGHRALAHKANKKEKQKKFLIAMDCPTVTPKK